MDHSIRTSVFGLSRLVKSSSLSLKSLRKVGTSNIQFLSPMPLDWSGPIFRSFDLQSGTRASWINWELKERLVLLWVQDWILLSQSLLLRKRYVYSSLLLSTSTGILSLGSASERQDLQSPRTQCGSYQPKDLLQSRSCPDQMEHTWDTSFASNPDRGW